MNSDGIFVELKSLRTRIERLEARVHNHYLLNLGTATELTIAAGVITRVKGYHTVDTQADAASDDLDTINGGVEGDILVLRAANSARTIVLKDGTGNLLLPADMSLDDVADVEVLIFDGANWLEITGSSNV
jgi:hypothetical protein